MPPMIRCNYITDEIVVVSASATAPTTPPPNYTKFPLGTTVNNCAMPFSPEEHLLECGHVVLAIQDGEPCGLNCLHVAEVLDNFTTGSDEWRRVKDRDYRLVWEFKGRYCLACEEEKIYQWRVTLGFKTETENQRKKLREHLQGLNNKGRITSWVLSPICPTITNDQLPSPPDSD